MDEKKTKRENIGDRWSPDSYSNVYSTGSGKISNPELAKIVEELKKKTPASKK